MSDDSVSQNHPPYRKLGKRLCTLICVVAAQGSLSEDLPQRQQGDILDFRFKIVDLNNLILENLAIYNQQSEITSLCVSVVSKEKCISKSSIHSMRS